MRETRLTLCDVAPRDGLQNHGTVFPAAVRAELALSIAHAGLPRVEAASFVSARRVPQMAGPEELAHSLKGHSATEFSGLTLNVKGTRRLLSTPLSRLNVSVAASEEFSRRNAGAGIAAACLAAADSIALASTAGLRSTATISTAFGCPFEGEVDSGTVAEIAARLSAAGADEIVLADTIGVASPRRVQRLVERVGEAIAAPSRQGIHLHDTRGTGLASLYAAVEAGALLADCSTGGIGGCPFAPGAAGNLATEDVVYALERDGVDTGIDLDRLLAISSWLERNLGVAVRSRTYEAGAWPSPRHRSLAST